MHYSHVLLDLDHTLLDTDTSIELAFVDALAVAGVDPAGHYATFDEINRALWKRVEAHELTPDQVHTIRFEQLNDQLGLGADPRHLAEAFATGMGAHGDLYEGAEELLDTLAEITTLAMVTNGLSAIQRARVERLGIGRHFDVITISAEVGVAKPGAAIFDLTFEALGCPARERALMVGDSLSSDIAGGNAAGIDTCWYNPSGLPPRVDHRATHTISVLGDLVPIVSGG